MCMNTGDPKVSRPGPEENPTICTGVRSEIIRMTFYCNWTPEVGECQVTAHSLGAWRRQAKQGLGASTPPGVNL